MRTLIATAALSGVLEEKLVVAAPAGYDASGAFNTPIRMAAQCRQRRLGGVIA